MNIVVIDDDKLVAISLKTILESTGKINISAMGHSGEEAITLYERYLPDVMLMDIRMQGMSGLEAGEKILSTHKDAKILYLTTFSDDEYIVKALNIGAKGYILKQDYGGIEPALQAVMNGQRVFGESVIDRLPELISGSESFDYSRYGLTDKEWELTTLVARGMSNKEIAGEMFLSEGTVRNYLSQILEKLDLRDRTQLAIFYFNHK
ncbi:response regulator transcription factor [Ruminococcus sp. FC2018]|uniref:response regulator n=1 Tax=Ruminococcus sp. FC2018 TaxID=1410617 RepID=UPI00048A5C42|nr:response regulator transcription factor [Ruminococcus sp. FC2018]